MGSMCVFHTSMQTVLGVGNTVITTISQTATVLIVINTDSPKVDQNYFAPFPFSESTIVSNRKRIATDKDVSSARIRLRIESLHLYRFIYIVVVKFI